jgi:hypothetical protein
MNKKLTFSLGIGGVKRLITQADAQVIANLKI